MLPNEYCPMGSPSLLNGDFYENIARLKDFSWSVFFSSAPNNTIDANNATGTNGTMSNATLPTKTTTRFYLVPEDFELFAPNADETLLFTLYIIHHLISLVGPTVYSLVTVAIIYKLSKCFKITRDRLLNAAYFLSLGLIVSVCWLFVSRMILVYDMQVMPFFATVAAYNMMTLCMALVFVSIDTFMPTQKAREGFSYRNSWITSIVLAPLLFLFAPVYRPDECPSEMKRGTSEIFFMISFLFLFFGTFWINFFYNYFSAKELDILKDNQSIGKLVKKEGFGWIESLNEDENDDNEQTIIQLT
ncbi:hypothetical protein CAEBREN_08848 [Caenorhabditis brenneri]|uniref:Uncharacterized protein n=1 Tax=Caenorhabditis brenneri TaxID=135651 RepID=G0ME19_CAEBE|nr:hypothetical protein CAEBREN_08848 [Caenorhabditis brenneri]